jgi:hypothetical protein
VTEVVVTTVCAWCCRERQARSPEETGAIIGLCHDHITRFTAEVDAVLGAHEPSRADEPLPPATVDLPPAPAGRRTARAVGERLVGQVADVLVGNLRVDVCDPCIAAELRCTVADASAAATRLAASADFLRDHWRCGRCGARRLVTRARSRVAGSTGAAPGGAA